MESKTTSEIFALPVGADSYAWAFASITLGMMRDTNPNPLITTKFEIERNNPFLYQNMLYMMGLREKLGTNEFDEMYETGYITFSAAAESHAVELNRDEYDFSRDDMYMAFSDLTDERRHPEWKEALSSNDAESDPIHPLTVIQLLEDHQTDPTVTEIIENIDANSKRLFQRMVQREPEVKVMLDQVRELGVDMREMKSWSYGLMDAWLLHNAHLFLRRIHGMYNPKNPERYEY